MTAPNNNDPKVIYDWNEVTNEFRDACSTLKTDELVHDGLFGLFEAMSAIEIMDPKMDAGVIFNNKSRKILQFKEAVAEGTLKLKDFTPCETLGIIDELLACFVTWLDGHSLIQSIFVCLYAHDTKLIEDPVLKAVCVATLRMVEVVRNIVSRAKVYEEEDFQTLLYSFKLGLDISEMRVSGMLREAEEEVSRQIKMVEHEEMSKQDVEALSAIKTRLKFWRAFYCALITFEKPDVSDVNKTREWLNGANKLISESFDSLSLGLQKEMVEGKPSEFTMLGFDTLVNQRLLPPSFPRETNIFDRAEALKYIQILLKRLSQSCSVLDCANFHTLLEFISEFSKANPCVLSRSVLQLLIFHNGRVFGRIQMCDMLRETIKTFNCTPVLAELSPLNNNQRAKEISTAFIGKASRVMLSLLQAHGHNRARQRERLGDILEEFGNLQDEADKADSELNDILQEIDSKRQHLACFGSWVLFHSLKAMVEYLLLGFELELFNPHEFHYIYWYLDFLSGWGINCLSRAERLVMVQEQHVEKKCGKKEKKRKKELVQSCQEVVQYHQNLKSYFVGIKCICLGIIRAYEGFDKEGKIKHPKSEFDKQQMRYEHRFSAFTFIDTPQPVMYSQYKEATAPMFVKENSVSMLYQEAQRYFERAMATFQKLQTKDSNLERLLKVAKMNFVVMKLASSGHKKDSKKAIEWDFTNHTNFPVIRLT
eukprot:gene4678-5288_t